LERIMLGLLHAQVNQMDREKAIEADVSRRRLLGRLEGGNGSANASALGATRTTSETRRAEARHTGASIRIATR
jgi:hypothetical protein